MEILEYLTQDGQSPFDVWLCSLRDRSARARIRVRLDRVRLDNLGDYRSVGNRVYELRIPYGPAYRIYFGLPARAEMLLLTGGDKGSQRRDIERAKAYWHEYRNRNDG
jgi:putative addiction module killer protein